MELVAGEGGFADFEVGVGEVLAEVGAPGGGGDGGEELGDGGVVIAGAEGGVGVLGVEGGGDEEARQTHGVCSGRLGGKVSGKRKMPQAGGPAGQSASALLNGGRALLALCRPGGLHYPARILSKRALTSFR